MNSTIIKAIDEQKLLTFQYKNEQREAEAHTYGCTKKGVNGVCAWQVNGSKPGYRLFLEPEMQNVALTELEFAGPRENYVQGDQRFLTIYAEL